MSVRNLFASFAIATILSIVILFAPVSALARRAVPDNNLAYPVLITYESGSASGFFFNGLDYTYLVTASHVLFDDKAALRVFHVQLLAYPPDPADQTRNVLNLDLAILERSGDIKRHLSADVVVIRIAKVDRSGDQRALTSLPGVVFKETAAGGILGVGLETVKEFKDVLVSNEVVIFGYPNSLGIKNIPQLDYARPLLRRGIVAGKNLIAKSIILDCPVYPGNSGGPVLEVEQEVTEIHYRIIGVVSEFVPFAETWINIVHGNSNTTLSNSGYSVVTPMDFVLELIK